MMRCCRWIAAFVGGGGEVSRLAKRGVKVLRRGEGALSAAAGGYDSGTRHWSRESFSSRLSWTERRRWS